MRIALLVMVTLFLVSGLCALEKGTINIGGNASYTSFKANSDAEALNTITFAPQVGYFFIDNLAADLIFQFVSQAEDEASVSAFDIGLGGRYFYKNFYGGLSLMHEMASWDNGLTDGSGSGNYLGLKAGYLFPIAKASMLISELIITWAWEITAETGKARMKKADWFKRRITNLLQSQKLLNSIKHKAARVIDSGCFFILIIISI